MSVNYEKVKQAEDADMETEPETDLRSPLHPRKCCPYHLHAHEEFSWLLWFDFPRALFGIALLVMMFWEARTPVMSTPEWFIVLLTFTLLNLIFLLASSSLAGLWFQRGKAISNLFGPYIEYITVQFLGSTFITCAAAHIGWSISDASPTSTDNTFAWFGLTVPLKYRGYSEWDVGLAVFVVTLIVGLGQLFRIYLHAAITPSKK